MVDPLLDDGAPEPRRGLPGWVWVVLILGALGLLVCGGLFGALVWVGSGPDTAVYAGKRIPARYVRVMEEVGAKEPSEELLFFYSDALTDIRDGFYFVSDRKVAVYCKDDAEPLTAVPFDEIEDVTLERETSFFVDSQITLVLDDGSTLWFPVSSEYDRDESFAQAIEARLGE